MVQERFVAGKKQREVVGVQEVMEVKVMGQEEEEGGSSACPR